MNDTVLFDASVYQLLRFELGDDDAVGVLKVFLADVSGKFRTLAARCESRAVMMREAHSIRSSAETFGFTSLANLARDLEAGAAQLTPAQMLDLVRRMHRSFVATAHFAETNLITPDRAA